MLSKKEEEAVKRIGRMLDSTQLKVLEDIKNRVKHSMERNQTLFSNVSELFKLDKRVGMMFLKRISEKTSYAPYYSTLTPAIKRLLEISNKRDWIDIIDECISVMEENLIFKQDFEYVKKNLPKIIQLVEEEGLDGFKKGIEESAGKWRN